LIWLNEEAEMNKLFFVGCMVVISCSSLAGVGGVVVKGVAKTWDEVAKIALKASGKSVTDDAVKGASKTIQNAASKYGDDVAISSMRGGVEVAEQSLRRGGDFVTLLRSAGKHSDDAVKAIALNSDDAIKYATKYGDDVVMLSAKAPGVFTRGIALVEKSGGANAKNAIKVIATELPDDQITQVFGAIERNPSVAGEFIDGMVKGGKYFLDKIFAVNGKQILAGGLTSAMIIVALNNPVKAQADIMLDDAKGMQEKFEHLDGEKKKEIVVKYFDAQNSIKNKFANAIMTAVIVIALSIGLSIFFFVYRKTKVNKTQKA
jgi:hypothetical protein